MLVKFTSSQMGFASGGSSGEVPFRVEGDVVEA